MISSSCNGSPEAGFHHPSAPSVSCYIPVKERVSNLISIFKSYIHVERDSFVTMISRTSRVFDKEVDRLYNAFLCDLTWMVDAHILRMQSSLGSMALYYGLSIYCSPYYVNSFLRDVKAECREAGLRFFRDHEIKVMSLYEQRVVFMLSFMEDLHNNLNEANYEILIGMENNPRGKFKELFRLFSPTEMDGCIENLDIKPSIALVKIKLDRKCLFVNSYMFDVHRSLYQRIHLGMS